MTSLGFDVFAHDRGASRTFLGIGRSMDTTGAKLRTLARVGATAALGLAAGVGVASVAAFKLAEGAAEDEKAATSLALTLRNAAGATDAQVASTESWITSMGVARGVADDQLRPSLARLAQATGSVGEAQRLASLAMDVSAGTGQSLESVTRALAKAQGGALTGLNKLVPGLVDTKDKTLTLDQVTGDLSKRFAGQAAAAADTTAGRYERLKLVLAETGEAVGYKLLPPLTTAAGWILSNGVPVVNKLWRALDKNGIDGLVAKVEKLTGTQGQLTPVWEKVKAVATDVAAVFTGSVVPAFTGAGGAALALASPLSYADDVLGFMAGHTDLVKAALIGYVAATATARAVTVAKNVVDAVQLGLLMARTPGTAAYTAVTVASTVATGALSAAQWVLNAAMSANPIALVVIAIAGLVAGLVIAYKRSETFRAIVQGALKVVGAAGTVLWEGGLKPAFRALGDGFDALGRAGTWLWNNALQPAFKFIVTGMGTMLGVWSQLLATLSKVPGFGWAKGASEAMGRAAGKALAMAEGIKKIPPRKDVAIVTTYSYVGLRAAGGSGPTRGRRDNLTGGPAGGFRAGVDAAEGFTKGYKTTVVTGVQKLGAGGLKVSLRSNGAQLIGALVDGIRSKKQDLATVMQAIRGEVKRAADALRDARAQVTSDFQGWQSSIFGADMGEDQPTTADGLIAYAQRERNRAASVQAALGQITSNGGISTSLLRQLQSQGSSGYDALIALGGASRQQLATLNALNQQTSDIYGQAAAAVSDVLYGQGGSQEERDLALATAIASELAKVLDGQNLELRLSGDDLVATKAKKDRTTGRKPKRGKGGK